MPLAVGAALAVAAPRRTPRAPLSEESSSHESDTGWPAGRRLARRVHATRTCMCFRTRQDRDESHVSPILVRGRFDTSWRVCCRYALVACIRRAVSKMRDQDHRDGKNSTSGLRGSSWSLCRCRGAVRSSASSGAPVVEGIGNAQRSPALTGPGCLLARRPQRAITRKLSGRGTNSGARGGTRLWEGERPSSNSEGSIFLFFQRDALRAAVQGLLAQPEWSPLQTAL